MNPRERALINRFPVVTGDDVDDRAVNIEFLKNNLGVSRKHAPKLLEGIKAFLDVDDDDDDEDEDEGEENGDYKPVKGVTVRDLVGMPANVQERCASLGKALEQAGVPDVAITRTLSFIEAYHLCKFSHYFFFSSSSLAIFECSQEKKFCMH